LINQDYKTLDLDISSMPEIILEPLPEIQLEPIPEIKLEFDFYQPIKPVENLELRLE
jgi:hypothetical protein